MTGNDNNDPIGRGDGECIIRNPFRKFNFSVYVKEEISQSKRTQQEVSGTDDRGPFTNRVYTFVTVPQYFESFMAYGLLQSLDHLLVVYTLLPLRCFLAFIRVIARFLLSATLVVSKRFNHSLVFLTYRFPTRSLHSHEVRDLIRFSLLALCTWLLYRVDISVVYHEIRTQSVIKIYIFFNLLEVADRLLSAICQDALDDLLHTGSKLSGPPRTQSSSPANDSPHDSNVALIRDFLFQYCFASVCVFAHCFLLLCQVTTLNVAFNSQNKSLVTVFISNNFVELKSNVFRKMEKTNLFQIACADVRERFHYAVWLCIVVCRNMTDTGWNLDDLWPMLIDVLCIFVAEISVDWIKHAFITKFNVISSDVYEEYTVSIAYDLLLCRQGQNTADYFDLLSRRMGLTPIPLSCLINVMLLQTFRNPNFLCLTLLIAYVILFVLKIGVNLTLISRAYAHVKAYIKAVSSAGLDPNEETQRSSQPPEAKTTHKEQKFTDVCGDERTDNGVNPDSELRTNHLPVHYTGYDQPARDDQFLPMLLRHRRVHSDSICCQSPPAAGASPMEQDGGTERRTYSPNLPFQYNRILSGSGYYQQDVFYSPVHTATASPVRVLSQATSQTPRGNRSRLTSEDPPNLNSTFANNGWTIPVPITNSSMIIPPPCDAENESNMVRERHASGRNAVRSESPQILGTTLNKRQSYSIDLGILSSFRTLTHTDTIPPSDEPPPTNVVRRRRKRTRTEGSGVDAPRLTVESQLPAMWERSSRNSVTQPFGVKLLVKQPLSDVARYSMLEGQIS